MLLLVTVIMLYPFWLMGQMSFRSLPQYYLGHGFSLTTWHDLFKALPIGREMVNSTLITLSSIGIILIASTAAGYAFGTLRYKFSGTVFLVIAAAMMVPMQSMIIPEYINLARLGFINHYYGAILVYAALGTPFATFLMTTYFRRLPEDVIEASLIDGLGYGKIFFRIMLPLAVPAIATVAVCSSSRSGTTSSSGCSSCRRPSTGRSPSGSRRSRPSTSRTSRWRWRARW